MTTRHFHLSAALAAVVLASAAQQAAGQAQSVTLPPSPAVIHTINTVTIPGTFSVVPGSVVQNATQGNPCNPGSCYNATATVNGNAKWRLQVTLSQTPQNFTVTWIQTPGNQLFPLTAGVYQTIATGTAATANQVISILYNANKTTGKGGAIPTGAQVAAVLLYRVIANP